MCKFQNIFNCRLPFDLQIPEYIRQEFLYKSYLVSPIICPYSLTDCEESADTV